MPVVGMITCETRPMDEPPTDWLLAGFAPPRIEAAQRLRDLVRWAVPAALEVPGAFGARAVDRLAFGYRVPVDRRRAPLFAWVLVQPEHVHLGFEHGVFLDDPDRRFEGRQLRRVRFITVRSLAGIVDEDRLVSWTQAAARMAAWTRAERLARLLDREPEPSSAPR
jgi:hypothetical protein